MIAFARKIGMTRVFLNEKSVSVTILKIEKQEVLQRKTVDSDGYQSVQVGYGAKKKGTQASKGHNAKYGSDANNYNFIGEFKVELAEDKKEITIEDFVDNKVLKITGVTKGKGFAGVVKRWHFAGQPKSHGHDHERAVGSIGGRWPQRVLPGKKMAGRMGGDQKTLNKCQIVNIDEELGLIFVKGSLPGPNNGVLKIQKVD
jgi:large subunit ribosomal protein L3